MNELKDSNRLREVIEVVNIILAILAKPATTIDVFRPIDEYAKEVLNQTIVTKVYCSFSFIDDVVYLFAQSKDCTLQNILSLWETLAVEQSKRAVLAGQVTLKT